MRPSLILSPADAGRRLLGWACARRGGRGCFPGGAVSPIGGVWHGNTASRRSISPRRWRCWPSWSHSGLPGSCSNSATVSTAQNARPRTRSRSSGVATGSNTDTDRLQEQADTAPAGGSAATGWRQALWGKRARPLLARPSQRAAAAADRTQAVYHLPLPQGTPVPAGAPPPGKDSSRRSAASSTTYSAPFTARHLAPRSVFVPGTSVPPSARPSGPEPRRPPASRRCRG